MNVPVFIDISLEEQVLNHKNQNVFCKKRLHKIKKANNNNCHLKAEELRAYFKGLGAEISKERSEKGIEDDLHKIIGVCDACFTDVNNPNQIEEVLNGIVSMFALVRIEKTKKKLTK